MFKLYIYHLNWNVKKTKMDKKRPGLAHFWIIKVPWLAVSSPMPILTNQSALFQRWDSYPTLKFVSAKCSLVFAIHVVRDVAINLIVYVVFLGIAVDVVAIVVVLQQRNGTKNDITTSDKVRIVVTRLGYFWLQIFLQR